MSQMSLSQWLQSENPTSRHHARMVRFYMGWQRLKRNPMAMFGLVILIILCFSAVFAPFLSPHDPLAQDLGNRLQPMGSENHLLGTDSLGRDMLSRLIFGSRITLYIVLIVAIIAPMAGLLVGTIAGYTDG